MNMIIYAHRESFWETAPIKSWGQDVLRGGAVDARVPVSRVYSLAEMSRNFLPKFFSKFRWDVVGSEAFI